jgi:putative transposase
MKEYSDCVKKYEYELIDEGFIMSQFSNKEINARKPYLEFVKQCTNENISVKFEFKMEGTRYISERTILPREYSVEKIIEFIVERLNIEELSLRMKNIE